MILISLLLLHRGEALNPGPAFDAAVKAGRKRTWSVGTFNPSGLGGKHQVLSSYLNHGKPLGSYRDTSVKPRDEIVSSRPEMVGL